MGLPFAYTLDVDQTDPHYGAIKRVAQLLGVRTEELEAEAEPGCNAYILVPSAAARAWKQPLRTSNTRRDLAITLRSRLRTRNPFLLLSTRFDTVTPTTEDGLAVVRTVAALLTLCLAVPRRLSQLELDALLWTDDQKKAAFCDHQLRNDTLPRQELQELSLRYPACPELRAYLDGSITDCERGKLRTVLSKIIHGEVPHA